MRARDLLRRTEALVRAERDLIGLWAGMALAQAVVPLGSILGAADLLPWLMLTLALASALRGRPLGAGPHPMLRRRSSTLGALARRVLLGIVPIAVCAVAVASARWFAAPADAVPGMEIFVACALVAAVAIGRAALAGEGETAWRAPGARAVWMWTAVALGLCSLAVVSGLVAFWAPRASLGLALGVGFLAVSLVAGDPEHLRQRRLAASEEGRSVWDESFPHLLALAGPSSSWWVVAWLLDSLGGLDFTQAHVAALHVVVWAGALWPRQEPVAVACLLHEVVPAGGWDAPASPAATDFSEPPEGALRFSPLRTSRTRLVHPWVVPVRGARISQLDDPVVPLWPQRAPAVLYHVLGDASFEADPVTRRPQDQRITLRIRSAGAGVGWQALDPDAGAAWRVVVLRAFSGGGGAGERLGTIYQWDPALRRDQVQVLDPSRTRLDLEDGDVLVVSVEGVAFAYELEIGAPVYDRALLELDRVPQLEDFVRLA